MISGIKYLHVLIAMQPGLIISQRMVLYKCMCFVTGGLVVKLQTAASVC